MNKGADHRPGTAIRMTRQRRAILAELHRPDQHPTADEVYRRVRQKLPSISLGTVYRNLEILSEAGLIQTLHLGGGQKHYDGGLNRHYHVRCARCGKISDVPADRFPDLDAAATGHGFRILGHQLAFEGICQKCQKGK